MTPPPHADTAGLRAEAPRSAEPRRARRRRALGLVSRSQMIAATERGNARLAEIAAELAAAAGKSALAPFTDPEAVAGQVWDGLDLSRRREVIRTLARSRCTQRDAAPAARRTRKVRIESPAGTDLATGLAGSRVSMAVMRTADYERRPVTTATGTAGSPTSTARAALRRRLLSRARLRPRGRGSLPRPGDREPRRHGPRGRRPVRAVPRPAVPARLAAGAAGSVAALARAAAAAGGPIREARLDAFFRLALTVARPLTWPRPWRCCAPMPS